MGMNKTLDKEKIYSDYHLKVSRYVSSRIQNTCDAEDVISQVFLKVYKSLDGFDSGKASVSTWIYTITRNTVIDFFRAKNNDLQLKADIPSEDRADDRLLREELLEELASALEKLDERERDIIILHYYSEKTLAVIAEFMDLSYSYVKILHKNAINKLKKFMM